jgi:hypothetical protein
MTHNDHIRSLIRISEGLNDAPEEILLEDFVPAEHDEALDLRVEDELEGLIFKLRSYQDPEASQDAMGIEMGMTMAADMLQNVLDKLRGR